MLSYQGEKANQINALPEVYEKVHRIAIRREPNFLKKEKEGIHGKVAHYKEYAGNCCAPPMTAKEKSMAYGKQDTAC